MERIATSLPDVFLIKPKVFGDERGFFMESFNEQQLRALGLDAPQGFVQDNHSKSARNVLRGLHYQIQQPQGKLVRVVAGGVFDVAVDLRRGSPTFGKWAGFELTAANKLMAWIPPGFAHGFLTLSDDTEFLYKVTDYYAPAHDRSLLWNDPAIGIDWPEVPGVASEAPLLSAKDQAGQPLASADTYA